jgi:cytochrome c oxidase subunit III
MSGVARQTRDQPIGIWGAFLFVATEATLFGTLIASYFYLRFQAHQWPPPGIEPPKVALPLALTGALVLAIIPMFLASSRARARRAAPAILLVLAAFAVQAGYLAVQIVLFSDDLHKFTPRGTAYGSAYYTLLGAHHAHVLVGLLLDLWVVARMLGGLNRYRVLTMRAVAIYWYFVAALGVAVVLTQVSPSL